MHNRMSGGTFMKSGKIGWCTCEGEHVHICVCVPVHKVVRDIRALFYVLLRFSDSHTFAQSHEFETQGTRWD